MTGKWERGERDKDKGGGEGGRWGKERQAGGVGQHDREQMTSQGSEK